MNAKEEGPEKTMTDTWRGQATGLQKIRPVTIFSPDRFVRDFLQGMLVFQGYQCIGTHDGEETFWNMTIHRDQVVFWDGLYLLGNESETARHRVQKFVQAGMSVMMLADRRWGADFARIWAGGEGRILWKLLDYRQVRQVMAQI
jgi:hypothetical protein